MYKEKQKELTYAIQEFLKQELSRKKRGDKEVIIYYDPDVDGLCAGHIMYEFLEQLQIPTKYKINEDRMHGCFYTEDMKSHLVINVDSYIPYEQLKLLVDNGVSVLSIDHHDLENDMHHLNKNGRYWLEYDNKETNAKGIIFNVNYDYWKERYAYQSGAGACLLLIKRLLSKGRVIPKSWYLLAAISLLSDSRPLNTKEARKQLEYLYQHTTNDIPFIQYLHKNFIYDPKYNYRTMWLDRMYIDYNVSPFLNACLRYGDTTNLIELMRGNWLDVEIRDRRPIAKIVKKHILNNLNVIEFNRYNLCVLKEQEQKTLKNVEYKQIQGINLANYLGVVASSLLDKYQKNIVILYYLEDGTYVRGSFRGLRSDVPYQQILHDLNDMLEIEYKEKGWTFDKVECAGHQGAFGFIKVTKLSTFWKRLDVAFNNYLTQYIDNLVDEKVIKVSSIRENIDEITEIANENQYLRDADQIHIHYIGTDYTLEKNKENFVVYRVDGVLVKGFNDNLDLKRGAILPIKANKLNNYMLITKRGF